jgi:hypothetical protein
MSLLWSDGIFIISNFCSNDVLRICARIKMSSIGFIMQLYSRISEYCIKVQCVWPLCRTASTGNIHYIQLSGNQNPLTVNRHVCCISAP